MNITSCKGVNTTLDVNFHPMPPSELPLEMPRKTAITSNIPNMMSTTDHKHLWVITGPAGCGKTSVAVFLQSFHKIPYLEGDTFHTAENVQKMATGRPLTDADRWDWLVLLREQALQVLANSSSVILTCSALKRKYRDVIRVAAYHHPNVYVHFIYLCAPEAVLIDRVRARQHHYMKDSMVYSQFASLESPGKDECDILIVDASGSSLEVKQLALASMNSLLCLDYQSD